MTKLTVGQKRKQKELRRKKQHKQSGHPTSHYDFDTDFQVTNYHEGSQKLSEALFDYAAPLLEDLGECESDKEEMENLLSLAVMCWNIGTLPDDEDMGLRSQLLEELQDAEIDPSGDIATVLDTLIEGKRLFFGYDPRFVMDFTLEWRVDQFYLRVISTMVTPDKIGDLLAESSLKTEDATE